MSGDRLLRERLSNMRLKLALLGLGNAVVFAVCGIVAPYDWRFWLLTGWTIVLFLHERIKFKY